MALTKYSLDIVVPCYNEEGVLSDSVAILKSYLYGLRSKRNFENFRIILVDDGSSDATWNDIQRLTEKSAEVNGIRLSRNFGHQNALLAGLSYANADAVVTIDADLQDDITAIDRMLAGFESGNELILGVRSGRKSDTIFKRITAQLYYTALSWLGVTIVRNHADFRLISHRALQALLSYGEVNLFLRGVVASLGFKPMIVEYERKARKKGETKYTTRKMAQLALNGVTSFSIAPLRIVSLLGLAMSVASAMMLCWVALIWFMFPERAVPGWASTLLPLLLIGGIQIFAIGLLGEYIGKIYLETKRRPRFIVMETTLGFLSRETSFELAGDFSSSTGQAQRSR